MKILITGMTNRMCSEKSANNLYRSQGVMLYDELREMGHDVDMVRVDCDDSLDQYDVAFVGLHPLSSITSGNFVEAAYALDRCWDRAICYVEDWSVQRLGADFLGKTDDDLAWKRHLDWRSQVTCALTQRAREIYRYMCGECSDLPPLLAFMLNWGDHDMLLREADMHFKLEWLDPTPIVKYPSFREVAPKDKHRTWVLATLGDHSKWVRKHLGLSRWELYEMGRKGQPKLPEEQVVQTYANCWGIACPGYKLAGSGWWRVRFNYAPRTGSILLVDDVDARVMDGSFDIGATHVEQLENSALVDIATTQRMWADAVAWSREQFRDELTRILRAYGRNGAETHAGRGLPRFPAGTKNEHPGDSPAHRYEY